MATKEQEVVQGDVNIIQQGEVSDPVEKTNKYNFVFKDYGMNSGIFLFFDKSIDNRFGFEQITKDIIENELDFFYLYNSIEPSLTITSFRNQLENSKSTGGSLIKNFCESCLNYFINNMVPGYFINDDYKLKIDISKLDIKDPESIDILDGNKSIFTTFSRGLAVNPLKESIKNYGRILKDSSGDTNSNYMKSNIGYLNDNIFSGNNKISQIPKPDFSKLKNTDLKTVVEKYFTDQHIITTNTHKENIYIGSYTSKNGNFGVGEEITLKPFNSKPSTFQSKFYLKTSNATLNKLTGTIDGNIIKFDASVLTEPTKEQTLDSEGSQIEKIFASSTKGGSIKQNNYSIKQKKNQNKFTKKNNKINKRNGIHFQ